MYLSELWTDAREVIGDNLLANTFDEKQLTDAANFALEEAFKALGLGRTEQTLTGPFTSTIPLTQIDAYQIETVTLP